MGSSETSIYGDRVCQEEAARLLLSSGFRPSDTIGHVEHIASPHGAGRTLGSVWRAMRSLIEREPELAGGKVQDATSSGLSFASPQGLPDRSGSP